MGCSNRLDTTIYQKTLETLMKSTKKVRYKSKQSHGRANTAALQTLKKPGPKNKNENDICMQLITFDAISDILTLNSGLTLGAPFVDARST